jgi:large subunit ribosomal protein L24
MKKKFSSIWKKSKQPRKQRKYRINAPLHVKGKFLNATLSKDLRKKYEKRNFRVKKGDKVKVLRGNFKKKEGTVEKVDTKKGVLFVSKMEFEKKDGSKTPRPINPSNVMITELNLDDKKRKEKLERKQNG